MKKVKKAVILAGGYGSRFMPFTKAVSKVMLPIIDTPTIQLVLKEAKDSGIEEVLIIVGVNRENIVKHFSYDKHLEEKFADKPEILNLIQQPSKMMKVHFITQKRLNGTGGALLLAKKFTKNEPFLLMFSDDLMYSEKPVSKQLIKIFEKTGSTILGCKKVKKENAVKYSTVEYNKHDGRSYYATSITEKPKLENVKSTLCTLGRYVLTPEIYNLTKQIKPSLNGEIILTDAFSMLIKKETVIAYNFEGIRYDIGNKLEYVKAVTDFALRDSNYRKDYLMFLKDKIKEYEK